MIKLTDYKNDKTAEQTKRELVKIITELSNCIDTLKIHSKHIEIMESISILHTSRTLFEIKLDKLKNEKN